MKNVIVFLDKKINGKVGVMCLTGWRKKLKYKANCIKLKKAAIKLDYTGCRF